jgi:hypothetical protein
MTDADHDLKEDARTGYRSALDLLVNETRDLWLRFNAMLVANSVIVAIVGQLLQKDKLVGLQLPWWVFFILPVVGLMLCFAWAAAISRGFQYHDYYITEARRIEEEHFAPAVRVLAKGHRLQMKGLGWFRTRTTMRLTVGAFVVLHLCGIALVYFRS